MHIKLAISPSQYSSPRPTSPEMRPCHKTSGRRASRAPMFKSLAWPGFEQRPVALKAGALTAKLLQPSALVEAADRPGIVLLD